MWALTLLPLALHPATQAGLDFDAKATAIGPLLERLSSQTGARLKAAPGIEQEIIFAHASGTTLSELEKRISGALQASWKKDGEFTVLTRTPTDEKAIWAEHVAYRRKLVDEALKVTRERLSLKFDAKALASGLAKLGPREDDPASARTYYERERALFSQAPLARLTDRLVLACDPNDLAAVGPYERHVFRVDPNPMQVGIERSKYDAAIAAFAIEQQAWRDAAENVSFPEDPNGRMVSDPRTQLRTDPKLAHVCLAVSRGEMTALFNVNLTSLEEDRAGFEILNQSMYADPGRTFLNAQMSPPPTDQTDPVIDEAGDSKEFRKRVGEVFGGRTASPLSPRMRELMAGVVANDPLSWTVSDVLSAYAKTRNLNVVAAPSEESLALTMFVGSQGPIHVGRMVRAWQDSGTLEVREKDGWATLAPTDRYEAAIDFTPRGAVAELMKSVFENGRLDIRDYARYAFNSRRLNRGGVGEFFLGMYDRSLLGSSDRTNWKSLQLYGSFSETEQAALETGGHVGYALMGPEQRSIVERMVYAGRLMRSQSPVGGVGNPSEPTEAFPTGVPVSCTVGANASKTTVIVAYGKGQDGKSRPTRGINPPTLATVETSIVGNPEKMAQYGVANLVGYALGTEKIIHIRVEIAPGIAIESSITVADYDPNATPVPWDKLPAPYNKEIADSIAQIRAQKANELTKVAPP